MEKFAAIVLAAGESRRMGEPKQLLPWGEHTITEQIVGTLLQSPVDEIVVVVGHRADEVRAKLSNVQRPIPSGAGRSAFRVQIRPVVNPNYRDGMLSSIKTGIAALAEDVRAAFIVLCDQPQLKATTLAKLRDVFEQSDKGLVVPSYQMRRGHPLLIDVRRYRDEILAIVGAPGLQQILRGHPDDILHVEFDDASVLMDVDTRGDYEHTRPPQEP
ncbi:MAG: nucleotidyltransferase family protein [Chloroflexi bacterium]|nr:nucleotidyltransferase family protein [Chloroflexota bacterium]